ncbi:MAG: divergent PAP2 family protein [Candidatus Caenarcaniphilales bacterium]|nr:divergent PAP2 family protein [Candidatus Caenarcaniphilales bacterium]
MTLANPGFVLIIASISSSLAAQMVKIIASLIKSGKLEWRILLRTGGMPSSHSAMIACLATGIGMIDGFGSTNFALALCFAMIVMYDAAGVRRAVGMQGKLLNEMLAELLEDSHDLRMSKIKELLGHTPFEVLVGAIFGSLIAVLVCKAWISI